MKRLSFITSLILIIACLICSTVFADDAIFFDRTQLETVDRDGTAYLDMDTVSGISGITYEWDKENGKLFIYNKAQNSGFSLFLDNKIIIMYDENGNRLIPEEQDGKLYVPAIKVFESLGFNISENQDGIHLVPKQTASSQVTKPAVQETQKAPVSEKPQSSSENSDKQKDDGGSKGGFKNEFLTVVSAMNSGFLVTLKLFAVTLIGALPLGLLISLCSISKFLPLKYITRFFVWIIRGTPLMLQLLIIFYIPGMMLEGGSPWPSGESGRFIAASVAFIINYAFYFSEIFRGGIENIPTGQVEAGQVLGMTKTQIFFNVTLLQMIKRIVPPISNEIITLVKDTSIARIISLQEVIWAGYAFLKSSHGYSGLLWPLFFTGVYYLIFNGILTVLFGKIEQKLSYFK